MVLRAVDTKRPAPSGDKVWPPPQLDNWIVETEASPDTEWLVDRLLPRDAIVLISGRAKRARKSLFTMLLTRAVLEHRPELLGPSWRPSVASSLPQASSMGNVGPAAPGASTASRPDVRPEAPPVGPSAAAGAHSENALGAVVPALPTTAEKPQPEGVRGTTRPIRALMVAYEGPAKSTAKLWRWLSGTKPGTKAPEWMSRVRWCHRYSHIKLNDPAWVARLCAYVEEQGFTVVIIDTFRRALVGNERDDENVSNAVDALERIRAATKGGCVIFVHHIRKPPPKNAQSQLMTEEDDFDDEVRGSSAIPGAYDHHLAIRASFDQKALWLFTRSKIDEDRFFRVDWKIEDGAASCSVTEWTAPLSDSQLAELHEAAPKAGKLRDFAKRWNLPYGQTEEAIDQLEMAELIREDRGNYVKEE